MKKILLSLILIPVTGILISVQGQIAVQPESDSPDLVKVYVKQNPATYQKSSSQNTKIDFAVQVAASSFPISEAKAKNDWKDLGHVYVQKENGLYKIRIGPYTTQLEAKETLLKAKSKGRTDAFIVVLQGTENDKPLYQSGLDTKSISPSKVEKKDVILKETEPVTEASPAISEYKVQLASYTKPGSFNTNGIEKLGTLESYRKGEMTIMMIGGFRNLSDARKAKDVAMSRGFKDAVIVTDNNGILMAVKD
ncbi:MAG: SPOR domain-containing protein [Saprospiraceae bacterium]|uniref:SPOR domain-containing protein n=1 Tax=Candidatus Opimibacter skivensis TaxID=2982028 RepID=A0A9D7SSZ0_9BACT|nr:SPOR domain-containing protein [Candidatus Opimibacter skivensis]